VLFEPCPNAVGLVATVEVLEGGLKFATTLSLGHVATSAN
jgi:hypothetical protein